MDHKSLGALLYSSLPPASDPISPSKPTLSCYPHSSTLSHTQPQCCFWKSPNIQVCFYLRAFAHDFKKNPSCTQNSHPCGSVHFLQTGPLLKSHLMGNFPGSPVAKTLHFNAERTISILGWEIKIPHGTGVSKKKKKSLISPLRASLAIWSKQKSLHLSLLFLAMSFLIELPIRIYV